MSNYQLSVTDGAKVVQVSSDTPDDVIRMLSLAGVKAQQASPPVPTLGVAPVAGPETCAAEVTMEDDDGEKDADEQAHYDIGDQDNSATGHEVCPNTYMWQGAKNPQRLVKGFAGDNPLVAEYHDKLIESYKAFLSEDDDRENAEGNMSPLTDAERINFDPDPFHGEKPVDDGSHSPMCTIERYPALD